MSEINISIEGGTSKRLLTAGKYCDRDIVVTASGGETPDPYMGDYEVTPKVDAQVLPTAQKLMTQDLTVKAIPYTESTNSAGGTTVTIG